MLMTPTAIQVIYLSQYLQVPCGYYVTSAVDCVRRACRLVGRRSSVSTAAVDHLDASSSCERKCGDGVDSACVESPALVARVDNPASVSATAAASVTDDVINCCSDDDTVTSSVPADCVTESSALTYIVKFLPILRFARNIFLHVPSS